MTRRVAFIVGIFPVVSETFITGQIAGLIDRGLDVNIFSFHRGDSMYATESYAVYAMKSRTTYLDFPLRWPKRIVRSIWSAIQLLRHRPVALLNALNVFKYGTDAWSLKLLCWAGPLVSMHADVVHCHFGPIADRFRVLRDILGFQQPWLTTMYGYDVSQIPRQKGKNIYRELAAACPRFLVMSEDMKKRIIDLGFPDEKVSTHPVGIDAATYPFRERADHAGPVQIVSVARLVEKKGIDDLIRALALVRKKASRSFRCTVVGDGPLRESLQQLARDEEVDDMLHWTGFLKQEDMIKELETSDLYVQPSKTAANGDME